MNPHIAVQADHESTTLVETVATDIDTLTSCGFSAEQIVSLLGLRQRYQHGGSDRATVVHHLEFLKYLVMSGRMDS